MFRFSDKDDYRNEIFAILSSGRLRTNVILAGNVIVIIILLRVLARMSDSGENKLSNHLAIGKGLYLLQHK